MKQPVVHGQIGRPLHDRPDTTRTESPACSETEISITHTSLPGTSQQTPQTVSEQHVPPVAQAEDALRSAIGDQNYEHWLLDRSRTECDGDTLRIYVSNPFISNWMLKRYRSHFSRAASDVLGPSGGFELLVDKNLQQSEGSGRPGQGASKEPQQTAATEKSSWPEEDHSHRSTAASTDAAHAATAATAPPSIRLDSRDDTPAPAASRSDGRRRVQSVTSTSGGPQPLAVRRSQRRRFRNFNAIVTGQCNQLAVMAARQVAEQPGECFNPLYIHGNTGVGKTHLLEAIYTDVRRQHPELNVVFISSEAFTNYFTQALDAKTVPSFRQRFRNVDVLLVDNIEFLNNKKKATEEEFLHTIVQVIEHGGQLVVTGDRHPRLLTRHREELTTRFMSGLVCRIESPCDEVRRQVATALALPRKECFTQEALDYVARRFRKNIREIQGAVNGLHGHYTLNQQRITIARAREILGDLEDECRRLVRISDVEKVVCEAFGLTAADLRSKSRRKAVACPRSLAMYVARKLTRAAYREIGSYFGGRDHSTVVAAEKRVKGWIRNDKPLELPTSCNGKTIADIVQELEQRLLSLAS